MKSLLMKLRTNLLATMVVALFCLFPGGHALAAGAEGEHNVVKNPIFNWHKLHYGKDMQGEVFEKEKGDQPLPPPFLAALFNFGLFAFILYKFGGPKIRETVKKRHETIVVQLEESARLRQEAQAKLDEYSAKLAALQGELDRMTTSLRAEAESEKLRILADAQRRAERLRLDTELQIKAELAQARSAVERQAIEAAVVLAETIIRDNLRDADQATLASRFVDQLRKTPARPSAQ